ncbi:MAG TPA: autotransporter domain-containing protein [Steroidobacteraceae bacterium]|nr:autotransporter domain-containing protein [Steroidobacteraceae bacterium]
MFFRSLARASTVCSAFVGGLLAILTPAAHAGPPTITGTAAKVELPNVSQSVTINLRQLDVIAGSAPLLIDPSSLQVLVNNQPNGLLPVGLFPNNGPGRVCIVIANTDFTFGPGQAFSLQLAVSDLGGKRVGPVTIPITNTPGDVVGTRAEQAACDDRNTPPVANAGPDQTVSDTDGQPGESVTLDASATTDVDAGNVLTYQWSDLTTDSTLGPASTNPILTVTLAPGPHNIQLSVNDDSSDTTTSFASDDIVVTVNAPALPTANAGPDQTLNDSDGRPGESVTLNGSGSTDSDGTIATYEWSRIVDAETIEQLGTGQTLTVRLPDDGVHDIRLTVTDNAGNIDTDDVVVTVNSAARPTANAGPDRNVADSDGQPGESVTLDASASTDPDGAIASYQWSRLTGGESTEVLGAGQTLTVTLPDGRNDIILLVTDNAGNTSTDVTVITVATAPPETVLSEIPGLTEEQRRMAQKLDSMCDSLAQLSRDEAALTVDQRDLLTKCNGIRQNNTTANQIEAIEELIPDDFSVARTQTLLFANTQYASIMDRLIALRGGARGLSLAGLNVIVDGKLVPLAQLEDMVKQFLGGGASADEPGGLLSDKWGLWVRGNFSFGDKDASAASPAFDADQWAFVGGLDYRVSDKAVLGAALSYGSSSVDFAADDGALDTDSFALSLYGSAYAAKNFYFDGIVNIANSSFDAERNITYVDGMGLVSADAQGDTDGMTWSGGLSAGYDFLAGGLTISPNLGFFYIDTTIDGFTESGAGGLNLIYDEQKFKSLTGNVGLRLTYAWNVSWGVLLPHLRADFVREFEDDVDVFGVRFASDPNAASTPPVLVATDNPDTSYWRLAAGFSAQFKGGVSGYIEYQRLESFEFISFQDVSIGLRFQRSF